MTRGQRIALGILGPPLLGGVILDFAWALALAWRDLKSGHWPEFSPVMLVVIVCVILYGYFIAAIPSLLHALIMEWAYARGVEPRSWRAVRISTASGTVAGTTIGCVLGGYLFREYTWMIALYAGIGLGVGFLLGLLVRRWSLPLNAEKTGGNIMNA